MVCPALCYCSQAERCEAEAHHDAPRRPDVPDLLRGDVPERGTREPRCLGRPGLGLLVQAVASLAARREHPAGVGQEGPECSGRSRWGRHGCMSIVAVIISKPFRKMILPVRPHQ